MIGRVYVDADGVHRVVTSLSNGVPVLFDGFLSLTHGVDPAWELVLPAEGQVWKHKRSESHLYKVVMVVNVDSEKRDFPLTIVYSRDGRTYSCTAWSFIGRMEEVE